MLPDRGKYKLKAWVYIMNGIAEDYEWSSGNNGN